jgi:hypothetical protein
VEFFFKQQKIARFDFKTARISPIPNPGQRDTFRSGPLTKPLNQPQELTSDIFVLLLT